MAKKAATPEEISEANQRIARPDEKAPRARMRGALSPAGLPVATALRIQADEGKASSETEKALRRATRSRRATERAGR